MPEGVSGRAVVVTERPAPAAVWRKSGGAVSGGGENSLEGFGKFVMFDRGEVGRSREVPGFSDRSGRRGWCLSAFPRAPGPRFVVSTTGGHVRLMRPAPSVQCGVAHRVTMGAHGATPVSSFEAQDSTPVGVVTDSENTSHALEEAEQPQVFVAVQFGSDDEEEVMIPVDDLTVLDTPEGKERVLDEAWRFYQHGQFVRDAIDPAVIERVAAGLSEDLPLMDMLARECVARIGAYYLDRFESEAADYGERLVDSHATQLRLEGQGTSTITIVFDPPEGWEEKAVERCLALVQRLFAAPSTLITSWMGFTRWLWLNRLTCALGDLEDQLGEEALEQLSEQDFERQLLARAFEHEDSNDHIVELLMNYVELVSDLFLECFREPKPELWQLEVLLGFRDKPPDEAPRTSGQIIPVDFSALLPLLAARPEDLYQLPPRRFEQLIAHIFERLGYDVELTPQSNDGGFDVLASKRAEADIRLIIECKRYTPPSKVGRPTVQRLLGVLNDRQQHATKAILATTSTFTPPAKQLLASNHWRLEGRDRDAIVAWIASVGSLKSR